MDPALLPAAWEFCDNHGMLALPCHQCYTGLLHYIQVLVEITSDLPDHGYHLMLLRCCKAVLWDGSHRLESPSHALNILSSRCQQFCSLLLLYGCKAGIWHQLKLLMLQLLGRQAMLLNITKLGSEACTEVWPVICADVSEGTLFWTVQWDGRGQVVL